MDLGCRVEQNLGQCTAQEPLAVYRIQRVQELLALEANPSVLYKLQTNMCRNCAMKARLAIGNLTPVQLSGWSVS